MAHFSAVLSTQWPQRLAASLAAIIVVCAGALEGWTSPALPYLQQNDTETPGITDEQASWIGSLCGLGAVFGALPAGLLADKLGRRTVLLGLTLPFLVGWIIIVLANKSISLLYGARFVLGLAAGAVTVTAPLYNEEISEVSIRGELGSFQDLALTIGVLYVYAFGAFVPYIWLCISSLIVPILFAATFFWMPESPMYLLIKGRKTEAEKSLRWLRNVGISESPIIEMELKELEASIKTPSELPTRSPVCKVLSLVLGLMVVQQLSGICGVVFYTVEIFQAAGSTLSPYYCTLIVGVIQVVATYVGAVLVDTLGRRVLLLASGVGMAISLSILTGFSLFKDQGEGVNWIHLVALNLYIVCFCVGFGPLPWFMMVEFSTSETKGWISSVGVSVNWAMVFFVTRVFTIMMTQLGQAATYGILCIFCIISSVFIAVCIPETKGKTRDEIQTILAGRSSCIIL